MVWKVFASWDWLILKHVEKWPPRKGMASSAKKSHMPNVTLLRSSKWKTFPAEKLENISGLNITLNYLNDKTG